jgi:hypothetical protein
MQKSSSASAVCFITNQKSQVETIGVLVILQKREKRDSRVTSGSTFLEREQCLKRRLPERQVSIALGPVERLRTALPWPTNSDGLVMAGSST